MLEAWVRLYCLVCSKQIWVRHSRVEEVPIADDRRGDMVVEVSVGDSGAKGMM